MKYFYAIELTDQEPNDIIPNYDSLPVDPLEPRNDDEGEDIPEPTQGLRQDRLRRRQFTKDRNVCNLDAALDLSNYKPFQIPSNHSEICREIRQKKTVCIFRPAY